MNSSWASYDPGLVYIADSKRNVSRGFRVRKNHSFSSLPPLLEASEAALASSSLWTKVLFLWSFSVSIFLLQKLLIAPLAFHHLRVASAAVYSSFASSWWIFCHLWLSQRLIRWIIDWCTLKVSCHTLIFLWSSFCDYSSLRMHIIVVLS